MLSHDFNKFFYWSITITNCQMFIIISIIIIQMDVTYNPIFCKFLCFCQNPILESFIKMFF